MCMILFKSFYHKWKKTLTMDWYEPRVMNFNYISKEVKTWKREQSAQLKVDPLDSISNVSRRTATSSTSAALLASAEKAALEAKAAAFVNLLLTLTLTLGKAFIAVARNYHQIKTGTGCTNCSSRWKK